mgnify:CR=1 FL=1
MAVYGLRTATKAYINELKGKYPNGAHVTHKLNGYKLPFNGVFYTSAGSSIRAWARIDANVYDPNLKEED